MRGFLRLVIAQATLLCRNVEYWVPALGLAVISMLAFGWLFDVGTQAFSLGIVDEDKSQASRSLVQMFDGLENVKVKEDGRQEEINALEDGDRRAVIVIPQGFAEDLANGRAVLAAHYDNSNPIMESYAVTTIGAVADGFNARVAGQADPMSIEWRSVSAKRIRQIDFLTPGMAGVTLMWGNILAGVVFLAGWREMGILRRLGVTPVSPALLMASQSVSLGLLSFTQVAIIFLVSRLLFDVKIEGSYLLLAGTLVFGIACMLSLGYIIGSFLNSLVAGSAVANLLAFPMMFLSGSYFPLESPPAFLKPVVDAMPLTHLNDALREIVNKGHGLGDIWWSWAILAAWAVSGFLLSVRVFRWQ